MGMRRREALRWMGVGALGGAAAGLRRWGQEIALAQTQIPSRPPFVPVVELALRAGM